LSGDEHIDRRADGAVVVYGDGDEPGQAQDRAQDAEDHGEPGKDPRQKPGPQQDQAERQEQAGYISGQPHPGDRRRQVVQTTEATTARDREVFGGLMAKTSDLLATYTDDQLLVIRGFLQQLGELTAAYADALSEHEHAGPAGPARVSGE